MPCDPAWKSTLSRISIAGLVLAIGLAGLAAAAGPGAASERGAGAGEVRLAARETIHFVRGAGGRLAGLAELTVDNPGPAARGRVTVTAAGESETTELGPVPAGRSTHRVRVPARHPRPPAPATYELSLGADGAAPRAAASTAGTIGGVRPWTIYICQDKHLDYGWAGTVEWVVGEITGMTDYYLDLTDQTIAAGYAPDDQNHWNFDVGLWADEYARNRPPAELARLHARLASRHFDSGATFMIMLGALTGTEELVRSLYSSRELERAVPGYRIQVAVPNETPTLTWGLATVLAGAGITRAGKGICACLTETDWQRDPYPLFHWEGPDGARVLMKWNLLESGTGLGSHAEAYPLWHGTYADRVQYIDDTVSRFEAAPAYPHDAILLLGMGWDFFPRTDEVTEFIRRYNAEPWDYPRLVNATLPEFYEHIEAGIAEHGYQVPVLRGDYGSSWERWAAQAAGPVADYLGAREAALTAEKLAALAAMLGGGAGALDRAEIERAYETLLRIPEHSWNGGPYNRYEPEKKQAWADTAAAIVAGVHGRGLATLAAAVATGPDPEILVVNPLAWVRTGAVRVPVAGPGPYRITERASGLPVPSQVVGAPGAYELVFVAGQVPSLGYRTYALAPGQPAPGGGVTAGASTIENGLVRVTVSPSTGAVTSLLDLVHGGRELANAGAGGLHRYYYNASPLAGVAISAGEPGPVVGSLVVTGTSVGSTVRTVIRLHAGLDRVDLESTITKGVTTATEIVRFDYSLAVPGHAFRYEGAAAILRPGRAPAGDHLPGSDQEGTSVQHFLDVSNAAYGLTWSQRDTYWLRFGLGGDHTTPDLSEPRFSSIAMLNDELDIRDQNGQTTFVDRYAVRPHDGPYDGAAAARFGWGARNPLVAVLLPAGQAGPLRSGAFSFLSLDSDHVLLTTLKIAEDGEAAGIVARLWETGGAPATVTLDLSALLPLAAERTDLVERPLGSLPLVGGRTTVSVPANGFATVRFRSAGVATGVGEAAPPAPAAPRAVLARVRPNPFVPGASLSFDLAVGAGEVGVRLELYDTRGRLVRALVDGRLGSGRHRAAWDGRDGSGRRVARGVYVARLVTPDGTSAQKLVLID